jgi:uncharacterized protein YkwD
MVHTLGGTLIAALVAGLAAGMPTVLQAAGPPATVPGYAAWAEEVLRSPPAGIELFPELEEELVAQVAERRREEATDLSPLQEDPGLADAARAHAIDMLARDYVDHVDPDGRSAHDRVGILHRRFAGTTAENLAEHTGLPRDRLEDQLGSLAVRLVDGFMASPGHRENLVSPDHDRHGIGAALQGDRLVVVHVFAAPSTLLRQPVPLQVRQGEPLPLAFADGHEVPEQYGYAPQGQPVDEIVPLEITASEVAVDPGTYRLVFLIPSEESPRLFTVAEGPFIVVN